MYKIALALLLYVLPATTADDTWTLWSAIKPKNTITWSKLKLSPEKVIEAMKESPTKVTMPVTCSHCGQTNDVYFLLLIE